MPSPNLFGSVIASRTSRAAITVLGNSVALYNPPVRVAEEMAVLDLMSRGRIIAGFPVGTSMDTAYAYSANPGTLRPKYAEAIDLIKRAWTEPEPFAFNGRFTQMRTVKRSRGRCSNPTRRSGSQAEGRSRRGTSARENDYVYGALSYYGHLLARENVGNYWRRVEENGKDPNPHRLAVRAVHRRRRHRRRGLQALPGAGRVLLQPIAPCLRRLRGSTRLRHRGLGPRRATSRAVRQVARSKQQKHDLTWDEMVEKGYVVIGSPDTVRETLEEVAKTFNCGHLLTALHFGNMSDELTRYNTKLFGDKVAPGAARHLRRRRRSLVAEERDGGLTWQPTVTFSTSSASRAIPRPRRCSAQLEADGWNIVVPRIKGFDASWDFVAPDDYLGWLTVLWDAIDATDVRLPCPVVGASVGGMLAVDLAAYRPEAVRALALLAPFGIFDEDNQGLDLYSVPTPDRMTHLFAKGVPEPFVDRFGELGPDDGPVARYLSDVAAANLLWPLGDRGQAGRLHRVTCPRLSLWGDQDELLPPGLTARWAAGGIPVEMIDGAGHLLEWDAPDAVGARLVEFLRTALV